MKCINYRCKDCLKHEEEEYYQDSEKNIPNVLDKKCPLCGGVLEKFNFARHARWGSGSKGQK